MFLQFTATSPFFKHPPCRPTRRIWNSPYRKDTFLGNFHRVSEPSKFLRATTSTSPTHTYGGKSRRAWSTSLPPPLLPKCEWWPPGDVRSRTYPCKNSLSLARARSLSRLWRGTHKKEYVTSRDNSDSLSLLKFRLFFSLFFAPARALFFTRKERGSLYVRYGERRL